jgi:ABC-type dipeptide/oligopeptide/nickel transport system permease subunit
VEMTIAKTAPAGRSLRAEVWFRFRKNRLAVVCLAIFAFYVVMALGVAFGLLASTWDVSVGGPYAPPSWQNPLGTDIFGRSVLLKTIYSAKTSLTVAFLASLISIGIGLPLGAIAGYFGKWVDEFIVWIYSTLESVPYILLILAFAFVLKDKVLHLPGIGPVPLTGIASVYLAIGLTSWVGLCRLIRGEVIKHKQRDYVMAAKAFGASDLYILFRHIVPNVFHLVIIGFSLQFVGFIQAEVTLSFLGLGAKEQPSWGVMIDDARQELGRGVWWQMVAATVAIFIISLALNIVGDALRDALDPKLRGR